MFKLVYCFILAATLLAAPGDSAAVEISAKIVFGNTEISLIRSYYREHGTKQKYGKKNRGRKSLPPGIAKNLRRGKPLPPGIAKKALPTGLLDILPPAPHGYERVVLDGKVLLVEIATQVIHDILEDAIFD